MKEKSTIYKGQIFKIGSSYPIDKIFEKIENVYIVKEENQLFQKQIKDGFLMFVKKFKIYTDIEYSAKNEKEYIKEFGEYYFKFPVIIMSINHQKLNYYAIFSPYIDLSLHIFNDAFKSMNIKPEFYHVYVEKLILYLMRNNLNFLLQRISFQPTNDSYISRLSISGKNPLESLIFKNNFENKKNLPISGKIFDKKTGFSLTFDIRGNYSFSIKEDMEILDIYRIYNLIFEEKLIEKNPFHPKTPTKNFILELVRNK